MPETHTRTSYREHLNRLPEVFSVAEVRRILGFNDSAARVYIARWKSQGFVTSWAPRSGIYFNLVANRHAPDECFAQAILRRFPFAVLIGADVLSEHGWITQKSNTSFIAVSVSPERGSTLKGDGYPSVEHAQFVYRSRSWWNAYNACNAHVAGDSAIKLRGFSTVTPGFALVDMWLHRDVGWFPDPDDLYIDDYDNARADIARACTLLNVDYPALCRSLALDTDEQMTLPTLG